MIQQRREHFGRQKDCVFVCQSCSNKVPLTGGLRTADTDRLPVLGCSPSEGLGKALVQVFPLAAGDMLVISGVLGLYSSAPLQLPAVFSYEPVSRRPQSFWITGSHPPWDEQTFITWATTLFSNQVTFTGTGVGGGVQFNP